LETIVLCLSVRIRSYHDPNFHIPSAALTLHLWFCEIVSASFVRSSVTHGTLRKSVLPEVSDNSQDGCMEQLQNLELSPMSAVGAALLRFILAGFWIVHWWFKVGYRGMPATEAFFLQQGLPAWLAWFDISFEVVIAVCLILGIFVPPLCLISLPILFASMWIYRRNGFYFSGGGIELPFLWACAQIAQVFLGPGSFRIPIPVWLQLPTVFGIPL
jgi:putative oxidoreductase